MSCSGRLGKFEGRRMTDQLLPVIGVLSSENCTVVACLIHSLPSWFLALPMSILVPRLLWARESSRDPPRQYEPACRNMLRDVNSHDFIAPEVFSQILMLKVVPFHPPTKTNPVDASEFLLISNCTSSKSLPLAWFDSNLVLAQVGLKKSSNHWKVHEPHTTQQNKTFNKSGLSFRFVL